MSPQEKLEHCPHCRTPLKEKGRFCHNCGRPLIASKETAVLYNWAMEDLFEVAQTLSSTLDLDALLKKIGYVAERLTNSEASSILLLDDEKKNLFFKAASGEKSQILRKHVIPVSQGLAGWVAVHGEPVIVNDVGRDPRFAKQMDEATGFVTRSVLAVPLVIGGDLIGVCETINKKGSEPYTDKDKSALQKMANFAAVSVMNARLAETQQNFFTNVIEILISAIEARNPHYAGHPARVAEQACAIGRRLGVEGESYKKLYYGALLHDVGMIVHGHRALADKAAPLARDRGIEKLHPLLGAELVKSVKLLRGVETAIRHHHEYWDGSGFPDGLSGENIPLAGRILCLLEDLEEIRFAGLVDAELAAKQAQAAKEGAGKKYDPQVVDAYLALLQPKEAEVR